MGQMIAASSKSVCDIVYRMWFSLQVLLYARKSQNEGRGALR